MFDIIAVLGRGIQKNSEDGAWDLAEDTEICDERLAHLAVRVAVDDTNPNCIIGGGELNLLAGLELYRRYGAKMVVCAYGDRSDYLKSIDAPSESMVMSDKFAPLAVYMGLPEPQIGVWTKDMTAPGRSNTDRELLNILELALRYDLTTIAVVTVSVHFCRSLVYSRNHLAKPEFGCLAVEFFASESVLMEANPGLYGPRIQKMMGSLAYQRNLAREVYGINRILDGTYYTASPMGRSKY